MLLYIWIKTIISIYSKWLKLKLKKQQAIHRYIEVYCTNYIQIMHPNYTQLLIKYSVWTVFKKNSRYDDYDRQWKI